MIEQTLTVISVKGFTAFLKPDEKPSCEGCNGQCGSKIFSRLFGDKSPAYEHDFEQPLKIGQKVTLQLDDSQVLKSSFIVYLMPLLLTLLLPLIGLWLFALTEGWQILFAILGGVSGFFIAKNRLKKVDYAIKVIKIYPNSLPLTQIDGD